jgi:outer membrane protein OmpA-like peptidoglycan-associated protein
MRPMKARILLAAAVLTSPAGGALWAQDTGSSDTDQVVVNGMIPPDLTGMPDGPEIEGVITARKGERIQVTTPDGTRTPIGISDATTVRSSGGLFGASKTRLDRTALLNGLPVTVKTVQWSGGLVASQVTFKKGDFKTAAMIRNGTQQGFDEQTAATEALRSRVADIDNYNVKGTTNVFFDTGKYNLSSEAQADLCQAASQAKATDNALLLVIGYTDSTGGYEVNQELSEKRAARVVNYLQQQCGWKPYRMLTPTGMAEADPLADNTTAQGKAQNRRVAVNILVSKAVDGM